MAIARRGLLRAAGWAAGLACALPLPAAAHDGEKLYRERCVKCHSVEKMRDQIAPRLGSDDELRRQLELLLLLHHAPDHEDHAAIIEYLVKLRRRP